MCECNHVVVVVVVDVVVVVVVVPSFDTMKRAIVYGSAAASYCVEKFGIERVKSVTDSDIHDRVGDFVSLMSFSAPISKL